MGSGTPCLINCFAGKLQVWKYRAPKRNADSISFHNPGHNWSSVGLSSETLINDPFRWYLAAISCKSLFYKLNDKTECKVQ